MYKNSHSPILVASNVPEDEISTPDDHSLEDFSEQKISLIKDSPLMVKNIGNLLDSNQIKNITDNMVGMNLSSEDPSSVFPTEEDLPALPGPMPFNLATPFVLRIVKFCLESPEHVKFAIDELLNEIIVTLPNDLNVNLSVLLKNADLSQTAIPDELLDLYEKFLSHPERLFKFDAKKIKPIDPLAKFHPSVCKALNIYTTTAYNIINPLCRGMLPLKLKQCTANIQTCLMEALFVAVFASYGLNQYNLCQRRLKTEFEARATTLYRRINHIPKQGFFYREPGILSTTINPKASLYFEGCKTLVVFENTGFFPLISSVSSSDTDEKEVAFPGGSIFRYTEMPRRLDSRPDQSGVLYETIYKGRLVETYDVLDANGSSSIYGTALRYAYTHFLSKYYTGETRTSRAPRANHGLVHVARTLAYVEKVIDYFSMYAREEFKSFFFKTCALKTKIALVFYVTARDNEIAFSDDPEQYQRFRKKTANDFRTYIEQYHNKFVVFSSNDQLAFSEQELNMYQEVLQYAGDPKYLNRLLQDFKKDGINGDQIALWHTLTLAHCLDLPRCYNAEQYQMATQAKFVDILDRSPTQIKALKALQAFAIDMILKTDDHLFCRFNKEDELANTVERRRGRTFQELSTNLSACEEIINDRLTEDKYLNHSITKSRFSDQIDFPIDEQQQEHNSPDAEASINCSSLSMP
jgi:hypothetical protein